MTSGDRMPGAAPRRSAPVARIDHRILRANVEALLLMTGGEYAIADLRHDAWGHGVREIARTLVEAGVDGFVVDRSVRDGLSDELPGVAVEASGDSTLDSSALFGLPGTAGTPVMRLAGSVLLVKALRAGEGVSYGFSHRARADTRIALVTGGYAQGIVRSLGDHARVRIGARRHGIVGRVAMDACVVDIGDAEVVRGDEAVFFGAHVDDPDLAVWTEHTGMTAPELVTAVGARAQREHVS
ncbi:alanine racemase C-terminal domain-containing protein [Microbacterium sp. AZCO]|uniref:alanine racemase C-terminal domain-containing protein n=1 Tax=Microbacterium sp. AZCO TaxID=3142976 RepID=UPI0031F3E174